VFTSATIALGQQMDQADPNLDPASARSRALREIERLEIEWNRINEVSDPEGKQRLLADDSYHVGPSGRIYNKDQDIEAAIASRAQKDASNTTVKFVIAGRRIRLYKGVAVVTATGNSITTRDGQTRRGNYFRAVHVWEKRGGVWQLVVDQVTGVGN
jgi:ketosteroid isomerase-like protein